jgi:uncharacterized protein YndB with AHSA1/START domain
MTEPTSKPFVVETTIDAPQETVFRALTDPAVIREWFGWDYDGLEGEIRFIFVDKATPEPPDRLVFSPKHAITLIPDGPRTTVRVTMAGDLSDASWADVYDGVEEGWRSFFAQLRFLLERTPDGTRRTVYLTGTGRPSDVVAALGAGEPWLADRWQRIVVDDAGHLVAIGWNDKDEMGITVSTYGLDDAAFAALRDRWTERWATVVTPTGP